MGSVRPAPPPFVSPPFLKKSSGNPYLEILVFLQLLWKIFKNEDFGVEILEKGKIFRLSTLKTEIQKNNWRVGYVYTVYRGID